MRKISAIILSVILFGAATGCGGNTYTISVPGASQINKIELMENGRTVSLSDDMSINIIANALKNADTQTNNESIQDFPVNAEDIVSINMTLEKEETDIIWSSPITAFII